MEKRIKRALDYLNKYQNQRFLDLYELEGLLDALGIDWRDAENGWEFFLKDE